MVKLIYGNHAVSVGLIYITQQDDRHRVRKHQQAVPPGASEHRDTQPRPEQVLADQGAAPRGPLPQGGRSQRPRAQGRKRIRVGPQGHQHPQSTCKTFLKR